MTATTIIAAIGQYDQYDPLAQSAEAAARLAEDLDGKGYRVERGLLEGGTSSELIEKLAAALETVERDGTLILFWTGHGLPDSDGHWLICRKSARNGVTVADSIQTSAIGSMVAKSPAARILLVFDTCYSGQGAVEALQSFSRIFAQTPPGHGRAFSVIASAHPLEKAREAIFMRAIHDVLLDPAAPRRWSDTDEMIDAFRIQQSVEALLKRQGHDPMIVPADIGAPREFIPNPRFGKAVPADDVETGRKLTLDLATTDHFELASRGIETGQVGWYFTGRRHILSALVEWLKGASRGIAIVTGPPGSGKSAVVGRLATLSIPAYREAAQREGLLASADPATLPPPGSVDVAVHAKNKSLDDCARAIATALDIRLADSVSVDPAELVAAVAARGRGATIVLDALDEAAGNQAEPIARSLLVPLAALEGVRVLVGTRRSLDGAVIPADQDQHARLRAALGDTALIFDLAEEPETLNDIAAYVRTQLLAGGRTGESGEVDAAAEQVALASEGSFLYGRIVARTLKESQSLEVSHLPRNALEAFSADLSERFPEDRRRVDDLLGALAWGLGAGLSRKVWPQVATALADGREYDDDDVAWILDHVGWHIVEASTPTAGFRQATYRLLHQAFVDYYREGRDPEIAHRRIVEATTAGLAGADWLTADGYLRRHASAHAAAAGQLGRLIRDPGFLAVAEPKSLALDLDLLALSDPQDRLIAGLYQRCLRLLVDSEPAERMATIHMTAQIEAPNLAPTVKPPAATPWLCLWARCEATSPHQILQQYDGPVTSVAMGRLAGRPVVASCSGRQVLVTDARTGENVAEIFLSGEEPRSLAWAEKGGRPVVIVAAGATLLVWDPSSGRILEAAVDYGASVTAIASTSVAGIPAVAAAVGAEIRFHSIESGDELREPLDLGSPITSLSARTIAGRALLACRMAEEWTLFEVDDTDGAVTRHKNIHGSTCIALGEDETGPVVAFGTSGTIEFMERDQNYIHSTLVGHDEPITGVDFGNMGGRLMVASGSRDRTVRLWSSEAADLFRVSVERLLKSPAIAFGSLAAGRIGSQRVIVTMAGMHLQVQDAESGEAVPPHPGVVGTLRKWGASLTGEPARTGSGFARSLSLGRLGDRDVVVMADSDATIGLYDGRSLEGVANIPTGGRYLYNAELVRVGDRDILQFIGDDVARLKQFLDPVDGSSLDDLVDSWARDVMPDFDQVQSLGVLGGRPVLVARAQGWNTALIYLDQRTLVGPAFNPGLVARLLLGEHEGRPVALALYNEGAPVLWDLAEGKPMGTPLQGLMEHGISTLAMLLGQVDGRLAVVGWTSDGTLRLWNHRGGEVARTIRTGVRIVTQAAMDDQDRLFFGGTQGLMALQLAPLPD